MKRAPLWVNGVGDMSRARETEWLSRRYNSRRTRSTAPVVVPSKRPPRHTGTLGYECQALVAASANRRRGPRLHHVRGHIALDAEIRRFGA